MEDLSLNKAEFYLFIFSVESNALRSRQPTKLDDTIHYDRQLSLRMGGY